MNGAQALLQTLAADAAVLGKAISVGGAAQTPYSGRLSALRRALQPEGVLEAVSRPLAVEIAGQHTRGATIVDWNRQGGAPDNVDILVQYDQTRFEGMLEAALAAG